MKTVLVFEALKEEDRRALEQEFDSLHFVYGDNPNWPGYLDTASAIVGFLPEEYRFRLKSLPALELVQLPFAGYEGWPERVACPLANASGSFGLAISEYLISAILFFYRRYPFLLENRKKKEWNRNIGTIDSIYGKTILVLGCGDLGSTFARSVKALGAHTIGLTRRRRTVPGFDVVDTLDHLHRYLPLSDIVVGTLPSSPATHHLLTLDDFSRMKPDALFANVGRGDLVALDVLEKVMAQHRIRGMILDVCEIEPLPADCPLWEDENVFITPHISGDESLPETKKRLWQIIRTNLHALEQGEPFIHVVNRPQSDRS